MPTLRDDLIEADRNGSLLRVAFEASSPDRHGEDATVAALVSLHTEGAIDAVAAFKKLKNDTSSSPDFFLTRYLFEKALPLIDAPVADVLDCVLRLYRDAGRDLAAGNILKSFSGFCSRNDAYPKSALQAIEHDPDSFIDLLGPVIEAGSRFDRQFYTDQVIRLCRSERIDVRRRSVYSIALIDLSQGPMMSGPLVSSLEETIATETDDQILASTIHSAFEILKKDRSKEARLSTAILRALEKGNEQSIHAGALLLAFSAAELPGPLVGDLLRHMRRASPANGNTLSLIGTGIGELIKSGRQEEGIQLLEALILANPDSRITDNLGGLISKLRRDTALLSKLLTRWLLRGERPLCEAIQSIVGNQIGNEVRLNVDANEMPPAHAPFVARKAIAYFFLFPITAASVVISLMRMTNDLPVLNVLGNLLLNPLLLSYTGSARHYVQKQSESETGKTKEAIDAALKGIDDYLNVLKTIEPLPALYSSEAQREAYQRHMTLDMTESFRVAEKKSVFYGIFGRQTVLYGRKAINYVHGPNGQVARTETELQNHGVDMEIPRMDNIDPAGLDYMLRSFKVETLKS